MKRLGVKYLKEGMKVGRAILRADGRTIIGVGVELTEEYILRLPVQGITSIYVQDDRLKDVIVEDIISDSVRCVAVKETKEINDSIVDTYFKKEKKLIKEDLFLEMLERASVKLDKLAKALVDDVFRIKEPLFNLIDTRLNEDYIYAHMFNVTALSLMVGRSLGYKYDRLVDLARGCLVHDIGILLVVPAEIRAKSDKLTDEEMAVVKRHTEVGFDLLRKMRSMNVISAHVAYQHHERYNGGGYPRKLKEDEILEFGYIAGITDVFDAITNNKSYKLRVLPDRAREFLLLARNNFFPENIVDKFMSRVPAYPVGTSVILTNNSEGVVIKQNMDNLNRPIVRILKEGDKELNTPYEIDLADEPSIMVRKILD